MPSELIVCDGSSIRRIYAAMSWAGQRRVIGKVQLGQRHFARLTVQQAQRQRAQALRVEVQVQELLLLAHHPVDDVAGGHQAQLARRAALLGFGYGISAPVCQATTARSSRSASKALARESAAARPLSAAQASSRRSCAEPRPAARAKPSTVARLSASNSQRARQGGRASWAGARRCHASH